MEDAARCLFLCHYYGGFGGGLPHFVPRLPITTIMSSRVIRHFSFPTAARSAPGSQFGDAVVDPELPSAEVTIKRSMLLTL